MSPNRSTESPALRLPAIAMLAVLLCCALASDAFARKTDRKKPMDINADHSDTSLAEDGDSVLTGNVVMTQGTLEIHAAKAVISRKSGDISRTVLTGSPVSLRQDDENGEPMTATAGRVDYDLAKNVAVFTGNAIIDQPTRGQMRGERIVYNVDSGQVTSGGDGSRVSMHILPKQDSASGKDKPAPKPTTPKPAKGG